MVDNQGFNKNAREAATIVPYLVLYRMYIQGVGYRIILGLRKIPKPLLLLSIHPSKKNFLKNFSAFNFLFYLYPMKKIINILNNRKTIEISNGVTIINAKGCANVTVFATDIALVVINATNNCIITVIASDAAQIHLDLCGNAKCTLQADGVIAKVHLAENAEANIIAKMDANITVNANDNSSAEIEMMDNSKVWAYVADEAKVNQVGPGGREYIENKVA